MGDATMWISMGETTTEKADMEIGHLVLKYNGLHQQAIQKSATEEIRIAKVCNFVRKHKGGRRVTILFARHNRL